MVGMAMTPLRVPKCREANACEGRGLHDAVANGAGTAAAWQAGRFEEGMRERGREEGNQDWDL